MVQTIAGFIGFETGDSNEVVSLQANVSVQSTTVRTGGYALKCAATLAHTNVGGQLTSGMGGPLNLVVQIAVRFDAAPDANNKVISLNGDVLPTVYIYIDANRKLHVVDSDARDTIGSTVMATNTWHIIDLIYNAVGDGTGVLKVYLNPLANSAKSPEISTLDAGLGVNIDSIWVRGDGVANFFWDDFSYETGGLTMPDGARQISARQGIAGTPTDDGYTKNGAATAALCWSDTPFSAVTNCSDSLLSTYQTMVMDKFSTDPGRAVEGTQVIGVNDTVNGVKVVVVGKSSTSIGGSGDFNIRRRVGGVATDSLRSFTTADAFYQSEIFADTPANLDAYEAGVGHGGIASIQTVEDVWMMALYTPNVLPLLGQGVM